MSGIAPSAYTCSLFPSRGKVRQFASLLVEDHTLVREKLASIVRSAADFTVVGEAGDGPEGLALTQETAADVVLMDISLPTINGMEAARILKQLSPRVEILFVSQYVTPQIISEALKAGGRGYIAKGDVARNC